MRRVVRERKVLRRLPCPAQINHFFGLIMESRSLEHMPGLYKRAERFSSSVGNSDALLETGNAW